jgi:hypothetical protein
MAYAEPEHEYSWAKRNRFGTFVAILSSVQEWSPVLGVDMPLGCA